MKWYLYVLRCSDNSLYTGITTDIERRLHEHNHTSRGAKYTKPRRPVKLVHMVEYSSRSQAAIAESAFKKMNKAQKEHTIS